MTLGDRIKKRREQLGLSQLQLAGMIGVQEATVSRYESGVIQNPPQSKLRALAIALKVDSNYLMNWDDHDTLPDNILPIKRRMIPVLGNVAAGVPIWADEEYDEYIDDNGTLEADFALRVKGDSMSPLIEDGDFVYVKRQPEVRDGQIAVVLDSDSATLKYFYNHGIGVQLVSHNPDYPPMLYSGSAANDLTILGLAVSYKRSLLKK